MDQATIIVFINDIPISKLDGSNVVCFASRASNKHICLYLDSKDTTKRKIILINDINISLTFSLMTLPTITQLKNYSPPTI